MANQQPTTVTFRKNELARLCGCGSEINGKLTRVLSDMNGGTFNTMVLNDQVRPFMPAVPRLTLKINVGQMHEILRHACEYCLVAPAAEGDRLQWCGRCRTARYCNAECERADLARHGRSECREYKRYRRDADAKALLHACAVGDVAKARRLVEVERADVNKATTDGETPLLVAAQLGHLAVIKYLVQQGAYKNNARVDGVTALLMAANKGHFQVVRYLVEQGADKEKAMDTGETPLYIAAKKGHLVVVQYLTEQGADKDKAEEDGFTPLYIAAQQGHFAVVQCLVEQGADTDKAINDGGTALFVAAFRGHYQVVRYLVEQGADVNKARYNGTTPLSTALAEDHYKIVGLLLWAGATPPLFDHADRNVPTNG